MKNYVLSLILGNFQIRVAFNNSTKTWIKNFGLINMIKKLSLTGLLIFITSIFVSAQTADVGIKANLAGGEVASTADGKIVLQTKDGSIEVIVSEATQYKRIPPENPTLSAAVASSFTEIDAGDKLLVTGAVSADKKQIPAKAVYILSKSEIAQKQAKEAEDWRKRGIVGNATKIDFQTGDITISVRGGMGNRDVVISPKEKAKFLRYAPDSIKYSEATPSNVKEIFVGDIVRALGDQSEDGTAFKAEVILSGAFQTVGGTVKSVDPAKNEIVIENIQTKKDVTIIVGKVSTMKKFPAEMAQRMAQFQAMRQAGVQPPQGAQTQGQSPNQRGQGGGMRGGDINDMFERLPVVTIEELKPGDMIAVSSTRTDNPSRITAIRLLSGVDPFLKMPQMPSGGGRGRGGQDSSFSIPGLEGADFP